MKTKTTLILPEHLMRELKRRAASRGQTLSDVVAEALQRGLRETEEAGALAPLPIHHMGRPRIDLADRDRLYRLMEEK
jgi:hypothetical protein